MRWVCSAVVVGIVSLALVPAAPEPAAAQAIRPQLINPAPPSYLTATSAGYGAAFGLGYNGPSSVGGYGGSYSQVQSYGAGRYGWMYGSAPSGYGGSYSPSGSGGGYGAPAGGSMYSSNGGPSYGYGQAGPVIDARMYDNYYTPGTIYLQVGATVRWSNRGQHVHTVTSDEGLWDSGPLRPGEGCAVWFPIAGTYHYHCKMHGREMKGFIVVRDRYGY